MRILVTGANGFVGRHAFRELQANGHDPVGFDLNPDTPGGLDIIQGDLQDPKAVSRAFAETRPDGCLHLGGIAFVPTGWSNPAWVMSVNAGGTLHVLEALRKHRPDCRLLVVSSSEVYGRAPAPRPLGEEAPLTPANPYAVSKMGADLAALLFARRYGMPVMTARPDNHTGPGQSTAFVAPSFAAQLAAMAAGTAEAVMKVGNLDSRRDFSDVRDVACAYRLILERGTAGQAYNVSSGRQVSIREVLDVLCKAAGLSPRVEVDPQRYRPADATPELSTDRVRSQTGWEPQIPLATTLADIYRHICDGDEAA